MRTTILFSLLSNVCHGYALYCESQSYKAVDSPPFPVTDAHCQATCNQFVGVPSAACSSELCQCAGPNEEPTTDYCKSPRACPFNKYVPNHGTTVAGSQWCDANCKPPVGQPRNCPCTMCLCGNPCGEGERLVKMTFDELSAYTLRRVRNYQGFNFRNLYTIKSPPRNPVSGYANAVKSKPVVALNGFARPISFSEANRKPFKFVTAIFTAAWQKDLQVTVIGRLGGTEVFRWEGKTGTESFLTPEESAYPAPVFGEVDEVTIITTPGVEDPAYPAGSGHHVAIENMQVCAPISGEPQEIVAKRSVDEEADAGATSNGPMGKDAL